MFLGLEKPASHYNDLSAVHVYVFVLFCSVFRCNVDDWRSWTWKIDFATADQRLDATIIGLMMPGTCGVHFPRVEIVCRPKYNLQSYLHTFNPNSYVSWWRRSAHHLDQYVPILRGICCKNWWSSSRLSGCTEKTAVTIFLPHWKNRNELRVWCDLRTASEFAYLASAFGYASLIGFSRVMFCSFLFCFNKTHSIIIIHSFHALLFCG